MGPQSDSRNGTLKHGFGVNAEQEITTAIGVVARLGWNEGKTEAFAFTAIDRLAQEDYSFMGSVGKERSAR
jgi:hypothetical protein